jgi:hypothetical protein
MNLTGARAMRRRFVLLWLVLLAALVVFGCSKNPEEPRYDNPFDPRNPEDPFNLSAAVTGSSVVLTWTHPAGYDIVSYDVLRSGDDAVYDLLATIDAPTSASGTFSDTSPIPTGISYYKLAARNSDLEQTAESQVVAASVDVPLLVRVADGTVFTRERYVRVRIRAIGYEVARIAQTEDFAGAQTVAFVGDSAVVEVWDLGPADADNDILKVYACALHTIEIGGEPVTISTDTTEVVLAVSFRPTLEMPTGVTTVPDLNVDLAVGGGPAGITRLRLAPTRAELVDAPWLTPAALIRDYVLRDTPQPQLVFAQFESEFSPSFTVVDSQMVTPDQLTTVTFRLDLPSNRVISNPSVRVFSTAVATLMRFSTDPAFSDTPWLAFNDTSTVTLPAEPGFHVVYAQYRNHWTQSAVQTDWAIFSQDDIEIEFQDPVNGEVLQGGTFVELRGRSWSRSSDTPVDSVKVNVGDGYLLATGTLEWSHDWNVPLHTTDTTALVAARAYTHRTVEGTDAVVPDSSTALITVTISQLAVAIAAPAAGTQIVGGSVVTVGGTAVRFLGGAPLDSVVVLAGNQRLRATGLANWSTHWNAPAVAATTPLQIIARAFAGADSAQTLVDVSVVPAR